MNRFSIRFTLFAALFCFALTASAKELIVEFIGSSSKNTAEFEVKAPWIVDWRTRGDYPGQMAVQVDLISVPSGEYVGKVALTKYVDNGVRLFSEGGRYRFQVSSSLAQWTLRVEQLTRAEAEAYTPKTRD
jgi:hypothetical protein